MFSVPDGLCGEGIAIGLAFIGSALRLRLPPLPRRFLGNYSLNGRISPLLGNLTSLHDL